MSQHLVSTDVTAQLCHRCQAWVLAAWEDGLFTLCDPAEVTREGELVAMFTGRRSYVLAHRQLVARTSWRTSLPGPAVVEHICHDPPTLIEHASPDSVPQRIAVDYEGDIPF